MIHLKCLIGLHEWEEKDKGFDPITGNYYIAYQCKHCKELLTRRCTITIEDKDLKL